MGDRSLNSVVSNGSSTADLYDDGATVVTSNFNSSGANFSRVGVGSVFISVQTGTSSDVNLTLNIDGKEISGVMADLTLVLFSGDTSRLYLNYSQSISITRTDSDSANISIRSTT